jgi:arylsulfatase
MNRSYTITADLEVPPGGGDGMIVTSGGLAGGYGLYLLEGKPVFDYNFLMLAQVRCEGQQPVAPGRHTIVFDFTYDGPGPGKRGTGVLKVGGGDVANLKMAHTIPFVWPFYETFDVGVDTRSSVNENDYHVPFRFNGKIDKLTVKLGLDQLMPPDRAAMEKARAIAHD